MDEDFFARDAVAVAADLLGVRLLVGGVGGIIVETEAYRKDDEASHSYRGPTVANAAMFGDPARAYVYRSYGLHWCLNFVCEPGSAVLIRALEPTNGIEAMMERRSGAIARRLCAGPGNLSKALDVTGAMNSMSVLQPPFVLERPARRPAWISGRRIGIRRAAVALCRARLPLCEQADLKAWHFRRQPFRREPVCNDRPPAASRQRRAQAFAGGGGNIGVLRGFGTPGLSFRWRCQMNETDRRRPTPPQPPQQQTPPGITNAMTPVPDHGEESYRGAGRLEGGAALITGADSGIGRAVAIAFAREGADIVISYLSEDEDAQETARWVEKAGRRALVLGGDITDEDHCAQLVRQCMDTFGRLDILVNNAAFQRTYKDIADISTEEWDRTFRTNIYAPFFLARAAVPHMRPGSAIINTTSIQSRQPSPQLLAYASTKGAISNFTAGLAEMVADKGIRVNAVAPGPIWTPLIPSTMPPEKTENFGKQALLGRAGQPAELAGAYVLLASDLGSYMTGAVIPVTGGEIMI